MAMNGGGHDMMKMMQMHAGMMGGSGMGMMDQNVMGMMMGDGTASPEKMREQLQAMHSSFDADKDGTLSIEEFEMLHSSMIRNSMVDRFQHLDADGNGKVTAEEMTAPADRMKPGNMMHDGMKPGTMMGDTNMSNDGN
ncbi:hypothetical protein AKJ29_01630 [Aliiroseovarius crassostreae]|uniref:EF-hand domain-containing protein n=2 Tax=Aliiroseovarius crassostreae TaxID=154981 RepID=A0A0P7I1S7_9RHOB|nr:hypothetical protein AKJ29_01630 [Aliiroseovarius crassostreae]